MCFFLLLIFSTILIYILYRLSLWATPKILMNKFSSIIKQMKALKYYKQNPLLINGLFSHLLWECIIKVVISSNHFEKIQISFYSGSLVTIENFVLERTKDTAPKLFMTHTERGNSRESCTNFASVNFIKKDIW